MGYQASEIVANMVTPKKVLSKIGPQQTLEPASPKLSARMKKSNRRNQDQRPLLAWSKLRKNATNHSKKKPKLASLMVPQSLPKRRHQDSVIQFKSVIRKRPKADQLVLWLRCSRVWAQSTLSTSAQAIMTVIGAVPSRKRAVEATERDRDWKIRSQEERVFTVKLLKRMMNHGFRDLAMMTNIMSISGLWRKAVRLGKEAKARYIFVNWTFLRMWLLLSSMIKQRNLTSRWRGNSA